MAIKKNVTAESSASTEKSRELLADGRMKHIAFIMDGNGRWAEKRGMPRRFGHAYGAKKIDDIAGYCRDIGIRGVTIYAFSTENWGRPQAEVDSIMKLLEDYLRDCKKRSDKENIKVKVLGDISVLRPEFQQSIREIEEYSKDHYFYFNVAINYGGRDEIVNACNRLIADGHTSLTKDDISSAIYTAGQPDPDMIVRTGGDLRISNFLMWQSAYSELYFTDVLWPDITTHDVDLAVEEFYRRKRRFGKV